MKAKIIENVGHEIHIRVNLDRFNKVGKKKYTQSVGYLFVLMHRYRVLLYTIGGIGMHGAYRHMAEVYICNSLL